MSVETRTLLENLPAMMNVSPRGSFRLTASYEGGAVLGPISLSEFRIPAHCIADLPARRSSIAPAAAEALVAVAADLELTDGCLIVEYATIRDLAPSLRWIDVVWSATWY